MPPTPEEFQNLRQTALDNITQNFQVDIQNTSSTTTDQGAEIFIYWCRDASGNDITGMVDVEFIEIFDRGTMLLTNKPTVGTSPSGEVGMLVSGGEFYIDVTQNGVSLEVCNIDVSIPAELTGGMNYSMVLWEGNIDANNDFMWEQSNLGIVDFGALGPISGNYYNVLIFDNSNWFNCDYFLDDPRPKTDITMNVPTGYDNENSAVYWSIPSEPSSLGRITGEFPIGQEAHFIFVTEEDNNWRYAIKPVTIAENEVITFNLDDTAISTESELVDIVNNL